MSYKVRTGGGGIWIDYETRQHPDKTFTVHTTVIAGVKIKNTEEEYDIILQQFEQIVIELNKLNENINSLETDLAICQTPIFFNRVESERVIELEKELKERHYEMNHLVNSIYRKTEEFQNEKEMLIKENHQLNEVIDALRKKDLSDIPTSELSRELYSRMNNLDKLEKQHERLIRKHKTAANMIADYMSKREGDVE